MKKYFFILLLGVLLSCKKEDLHEPGISYPLSYLPVYPGSWWSYETNTVDTVAQSTDPEYKLHSYKPSGYDHMTEPVYVPFWNNLPVYGYNTAHLNNDGSSTMNTWLSESTKSWTIYSHYGVVKRRRVANLDTTITYDTHIYPDCIKMVEEVNAPGYWMLMKISYYAKNIGLVGEININPNSPHDSTWFYLTDYYINK